MEHKPQSLRVKAVERLLGQLRQEGRLVVKPVVTHPPKLPYKRHNPNETGLKRYELKGGRYLIRSNEPRRNRKCKNLDRDRLRDNESDDHATTEGAVETCDEESVELKPETLSIETAENINTPTAPEISTTSTVTFITATADTSSLTTITSVKSSGIERRSELIATTSSPALGPSQIHHHHHNLTQNQHSEDDGQALYFQTDHSMFYLSSLEDGFLTEEITEQI